jgi:hypothetical protein
MFNRYVGDPALRLVNDHRVPENPSFGVAPKPSAKRQRTSSKARRPRKR